MRASNKEKYIYICSHGGCGSQLIQKALIGETSIAYHLHSFNPPKNIEYIYGGRFNTIKQPSYISEKEKIIIYIYKNPIQAIFSSFNTPQHLINMGINTQITIDDVISSKKDLFRLNEYFNNYITDNDRDYPIYCIKYEEIFKKETMANLSELIGVNIKPIVKKETKHIFPKYKELEEIYHQLIDKMDKLPAIYISR